MADNNIELGLDLKDTASKAAELASNLNSVKEAAKGVADSYELVAQAEAGTGKRGDSPFFESLSKADVGLAPLDQAARKTTEFQESLQRLDAVLKRVDDDQLVFVQHADAFTTIVDEEIAAARGATSAVDSLGRSKGNLATAARTASKAVDETGKRMGALSRGALQTSQALQDVAQGGLASGLNNVDGIVGNLATSFGFTATAAATASAAILGIGTVALIAGPPLWDWVSHLGEARNAIPPATDALEAYTEAIKENAKWIKEVTDKGYLLDDEVAEYNRRLAENTQLEKDSTEAKKARTAQEKLSAVQTKEAAEASRRAAEVLQDELAGKTDSVIQSLASQMARNSQELKGAVSAFDKVMREYDEALTNAQQAGDQDVANAVTKKYSGMLENLRKTQGDIQKRIASEAANLVGDAVLTGNQAAIQTISEALSGTANEFAKTFKGTGEQLAKDALDRKAWQAAVTDYVREAGGKIDEAARKVKARASDLVPGDVADAAADKVKKARTKIAEELAKIGPDLFLKDAESTAMAIRDRVDAILSGVDAGVQDVEKKAEQAQAKINAAPAKIGPDPFEGINSFEDLAFGFDDEGNRVELPREREERMMDEAKDAGIRRRSELRKPVRQVAESFGMDLSPQMLEQAAGMVEFGQRNQGMAQADAIVAALEQLMMNQQLLAGRQNADGGRVDRVLQGARRVPSLLEYGQW